MKNVEISFIFQYQTANILFIFYFWRGGRRTVSYHFSFNLHTSPDLTFLKKAGSLDLDSGAPRASPLERGSRASQIPVCPFTQLKSQLQEKKPGRLDLILGLGLLSGWGTETKGQLSLLCLYSKLTLSAPPPGCLHLASQGPQGLLSSQEP